MSIKTSIYGPRQKPASTVQGADLSEYATKTYVDSQKMDKSGGTMTGDLEMGDNKIVQLGDPISPTDAANRKYVDDRHRQHRRDLREHISSQTKHLITIWAEASGALRRGYEWSFGHGARGRDSQDSTCGYTMTCGGKIIRMGLSSGVGADAAAITVVPVINGTNQAVGISKPADQRAVVISLDQPLQLEQGNVINFYTTTQNRGATWSVVSLLIELDI